MRMPKSADAEVRVSRGGQARCGRFRLKQDGRRELVAETGAHGHALAADGAAAAQNGCAALGLHARAKTVRLHAFAAIRLKCALGHKNALLFPGSVLQKSAPRRQVLSISQVAPGIQPHTLFGAEPCAAARHRTHASSRSPRASKQGRGLAYGLDWSVPQGDPSNPFLCGNSHWTARWCEFHHHWCNWK
jgi:hypothetical protein